jgi:hypothetical protein
MKSKLLNKAYLNLAHGRYGMTSGPGYRKETDKILTYCTVYMDKPTESIT